MKGQKSMSAEIEAPSEFLEAMQEAADILVGKRKPERLHRPPAEIDVRAIRRKLGLSQPDFAARFGFSLGALREWEQGRRRPEQAARTLLLVIARHPEIVEEALVAA